MKINAYKETGMRMLIVQLFIGIKIRIDAMSTNKNLVKYNVLKH